MTSGFGFEADTSAALVAAVMCSSQFNTLRIWARSEPFGRSGEHDDKPALGAGGDQLSSPGESRSRFQ
jgi:hypothetical protein